jgi:hypothetical protein
MPPDLLAPTLLEGMRPSDWYRLLNGFVFLWANRERVLRHRRAFGKRRQALLVFDAIRLLANLGNRVYLSPINSGNARRHPVPRSSRLFVPYHEWLATGWPILGERPRSRLSPPAEIVIEGNLPLRPYLIKICNA